MVVGQSCLVLFEGHPSWLPYVRMSLQNHTDLFMAVRLGSNDKLLDRLRVQLKGRNRCQGIVARVFISEGKNGATDSNSLRHPTEYGRDAVHEIHWENPAL